MIFEQVLSPKEESDSTFKERKFTVKAPYKIVIRRLHAYRYAVFSPLGTYSSSAHKSTNIPYQDKIISNDKINKN